MDFFSNKKNFRIHSLAFKGQYTLSGIDAICSILQSGPRSSPLFYACPAASLLSRKVCSPLMVIVLSMFFSNKKNFRVHVRIHPLAFEGQYTHRRDRSFSLGDSPSCSMRLCRSQCAGPGGHRPAQPPGDALSSACPPPGDSRPARLARSRA
jgi:hypothetical protein